MTRTEIVFIALMTGIAAPAIAVLSSLIYPVLIP